jgi:fructosamine-3-kinase
MLQSGNAGIDKATGQPVIFDPASYYGHNEAEYEISTLPCILTDSRAAFLLPAFLEAFQNPFTRHTTSMRQKPNLLKNIH